MSKSWYANKRCHKECQHVVERCEKHANSDGPQTVPYFIL